MIMADRKRSFQEFDKEAKIVASRASDLLNTLNIYEGLLSLTKKPCCTHAQSMKNCILSHFYLVDDEDYDLPAAAEFIRSHRRQVCYLNKLEHKQFMERKFMECVLNPQLRENEKLQMAYFLIDEATQMRFNVCRLSFCFAYGCTVDLLKKLSLSKKMIETAIKPRVFTENGKQKQLKFKDLEKVFVDNVVMVENGTSSLGSFKPSKIM
jgi:hypothetical protein